MIKKHFYTWKDIENCSTSIVNQMYKDQWRPDYIVGITRGGNVPATIISNMTGIRCEAIKVSLRDSGYANESNAWMAEDAFGSPYADSNGQGKNILIVDDIDLNIKILVKMIDQRRNNLKIHTSLNGKEAIELANSNKYSLILMDIHMPEVNGLEAALSISTKSSHNRNTPIVFISADLAIKDEKIKKAGGKFLLHKPISKKILNDTVQKYLNYN